MKKESISVNAFYNTLYRVLNLLFPLVTTTYISRILLPEGVGKVTYAVNIVQYFVIIAGLGIPNYGIREISKAKGDSKKTNLIFSELFVLNMFSTICCCIAYFSLIMNMKQLQDNISLHIIVGSLLFFNFINVEWFYQGNEQFKYIAARNFGVKLFSLVLLFLCVKDYEDYNLYAAIYCFALGGNHLLNILNLKGKVNFIIKGINIKRHLKPVLLLLASVIAIELYTMVDITMLGAICGDEIVGYYSNANKLARVINSLIASIGTVLLPRLSYYLANNQMKELQSLALKTQSILLLLAVPAVFGVFLLAENMIVVLFGQAFLPATNALRIMSGLVIAVVFNNFYGTQILIAMGQERKLLYAVIFGAITNICLNSILIPIYQHNGAAFASVASELIVWFITKYYASKHVATSTDNKDIFSISIATIAMIIVVYMVMLLNLPVVLELIVSVIAGVICYASIVVLLKNSSALFIYEKIRRV